MTSFIDITGQHFGRLVVLERASISRKEVLWRCQCDCGQHCVIRGWPLRNGRVQSCGCYQRDLLSAQRTTHGDTNSFEYRVWTNIKTRCTNPNATRWESWGGRGIRMCDEWLHDYAAFLAYVGRAPSTEHSIDRYPDNDGHYEPGNVRWATRSQQRRNRSLRRTTITTDRT
jgi:hypothetical protein